MRLKGINPFEQHAEKIVAGIFALGLLGLLAMQFLTAHPTVKVGNQERSLQDAYEPIKSEATKVEKKMKAPEPEDLPPGAQPVVSSFQQFQADLTAPVAPQAQFSAPLDLATPIGSHGAQTMGPNTPIVEVSFPAPTHVMGASYMATVATYEAQNPEVAKILPPVNPLDKASVTVEGLLDGAAIKAALSQAPQGADAPRAIPRNWWDTSEQILAVELTRQTLGPDGSWSPEERVKAMPGRDLLLDRVDKLNDATMLRDAAKHAGEQPDTIRRTPYYATTFGEAWMAPSEQATQAGQAAGQQGKVRQSKDALAAVDRQIKAVEKQIADIGHGPAAPVGGGRPGLGGGGGGGGGRGGGGGGGGGAAPPPQPNPTADEAKRKQLDKRLEELKANRAKIVATLRELGEVVEGDNVPMPGNEPPKTAKAEPAMLENPAIRLWAHDVFVERGKTYRYRMVVVLTNPYFGHSAAMVPAQAEKLAKSGVVRTAASEWTDPIAVEQDQYVFFTSATEDDVTLGRTAKASAEIYQFKWGFWRKGSKELDPGDLITAELKIPDFSKFLAAAPAGDQPGQPAAPPPPTGGGGGGRGGRILGGGGGGGGQPAAPPPANAVPAGSQVPMNTVPVESGKIMLGVGSGPIREASGRTKDAPLVFIRDSDGQVKTVIPDLEKQDPAYARISHSAERGAKELNPPTPERGHQPPGGPVIPPGRDRPGAPPPPPPGGGG